MPTYLAAPLPRIFSALPGSTHIRRLRSYIPSKLDYVLRTKVIAFYGKLTCLTNGLNLQPKKIGSSGGWGISK
jgi:hypothetical protein